ncbi:hypothetical protein YC2023_074366 [Brassica napus]
MGDESLPQLNFRNFHLVKLKKSHAGSVAVGRFHHSLVHGYRMIPGDNATPHKGKLSAKVGINKFIHRIISLDDVKAVKSAMNMTVNDIFLGIVQAGISRYLIILCTKLLSNIILITSLQSMTSAVLEVGSHKLDIGIFIYNKRHFSKPHENIHNNLYTDSIG